MIRKHQQIAITRRIITCKCKDHPSIQQKRDRYTTATFHGDRRIHWGISRDAVDVREKFEEEGVLQSMLLKTTYLRDFQGHRIDRFRRR